MKMKLFWILSIALLPSLTEGRSPFDCANDVMIRHYAERCHSQWNVTGGDIQLEPVGSASNNTAGIKLTCPSGYRNANGRDSITMMCDFTFNSQTTGRTVAYTFFSTLCDYMKRMNCQTEDFNCGSPCQTGYKCILDTCVVDVQCDHNKKYGEGPPSRCKKPIDPNKLPPSPLESWFTRDIFNDLFPRANLGWGPNVCSPYNYEAFVIAARYFPRFGSESPDNGYTARENNRRDLATFFAQVTQETGEQNTHFYEKMQNQDAAAACFYRGGMFHWFEGGQRSSYLPSGQGLLPTGGELCFEEGRYCTDDNAETNLFYPCNNKTEGNLFRGCYFGRGVLQLTHNYNYGLFQTWLLKQDIKVDLVNNPNLIMTKTDPPLSILASIWFYMTPHPPVPSMHDVVMGNWIASATNKAAGFSGPVFAPTSWIINTECGGLDEEEPGRAGESRRIKAFKWFTGYFGVPTGPEETLSCKTMPEGLDVDHDRSYGPDWSSLSKNEPCLIPFFKPEYYPDEFLDFNAGNKERCEEALYRAPEVYGIENYTCLSVGPQPML